MRGAGMGDDRPRREDRTRHGEVLDARGDIYRLAEIVLPVIEDNRQAGADMDADLKREITVTVPDLAYRLAHAHRSSDCTVRRRKGRHNRISYGLHHGTGFG